MELGKKKNGAKNKVKLSERGLERQKLKNQISIEYYEKKIVFLGSRNLHPQLAILACKDAPVTPENISSSGGLKRHLKKCKRYYEKKLTDLRSEKKKLFGKGFFSDFF